MKAFKAKKEAESYRNGLVKFLNEYGLNGMAILAMISKSEMYTYAPSELIVEHAKRSQHIFFLMEGSVEIFVKESGKDVLMGELKAMTMLGEIAFFNDTPATATAKVAAKNSAIIFRLGYSDFHQIIEKFPNVRSTLARIGNLRMIRQLEGYIGFRMFMDLIGWRKNRFSVSRASSEDLEHAVKHVLMPLLNKKEKIVEIGDGPGLVSEMLYDSDPELLDDLHLVVSNLEDAIADPGVARPSDFMRAGKVKHKFGALIALQVFNIASRGDVEGQLLTAYGMLNKGGLLFAVKSQTLDITYNIEAGGNFTFNSLEELVNKHWPSAGGAKGLIETTFIDADLDASMEWNKVFCKEVVDGKLKIPAKAHKEDKVLLGLLMEQAKRRLFDPEDLHYRWLAWKAEDCGFNLLRSEKIPESAFFYHLLQKD